MLKFRYDTEPNNTQDNDILDNDTQHNETHCDNTQNYGTQHNEILDNDTPLKRKSIKGQTLSITLILYDNNFTSIIHLYFYKHLYSKPFHSLDTLSDVRIKVFTRLF
jgi:hypothetical protein